jgi:hypothetical protein
MRSDQIDEGTVTVGNGVVSLMEMDCSRGPSASMSTIKDQTPNPNSSVVGESMSNGTGMSIDL